MSYTSTQSMATPEAGALGKTRQQVEDLKHDWRCDPCWDIEDTEGFEEYREELLSYRLTVERAQADESWRKRVEKARELDCSVKLADYVLSLEYQLDRMTARLDALEEKR